MEQLFPETLPVSANIALFLLAAGIVWFSGTRMVYYGDEMAERFGITREFVGLFFLATATELPEIVTTGYGDLYNGGTFQTRYTAGFGGTSGASPMLLTAMSSRPCGAPSKSMSA